MSVGSLGDISKHVCQSVPVKVTYEEFCIVGKNQGDSVCYFARCPDRTFYVEFINVCSITILVNDFATPVTVIVQHENFVRPIIYKLRSRGIMSGLEFYMEREYMALVRKRAFVQVEDVALGRQADISERLVGGYA